MSGDCGCAGKHARRRIVLTGGPGAGKTAVLQLVRYTLCRHVAILPESAGIVFSGGFPRTRDITGRALEILQAGLPECCRAHIAKALSQSGDAFASDAR